MPFSECLPPFAPALASAGDSGGRRCHLVWCVQTRADYLALASRLPLRNDGGLEVTVYVTRSDAAACERPSRPQRHGQSAWALSDLPQAKDRSMASVPLATTLVGLAVEWWGWDYVHRQLEPDLTLGRYFLIRRCLPLALILAAMAVTTAAGLPLLTTVVGGRRSRTSEDVLHLAQQDSASSPSPQAAPDVELPDSATMFSQGATFAATDQAETSALDIHDVREGRPDLFALVRAAAAPRETHSLVVAACGPIALVEATRKAVIDNRKLCQRMGVRLEFSGTDSRW